MKILAEVGSNWRTMHDCLKSIELAKEAGADIVKFQLFTPEDLYGPNSYAKMDLLEFSLPKHWVPQLKEHADRCGIEFMCTAFSLAGYKYLDPFVSTHKVASCEVWDTQIMSYLETVGKPTLVSSGACADLRHFNYLLDDMPRGFVFMFCEGSYPAKNTHWEFYDHIREERLGNIFGLSDHSVDTVFNPLMAKERGFAYLEKHVSFIKAKTPDSEHSLSFKEFKSMIETIKSPMKPKKTDVPEPNLYMISRCLIATRSIKCGDEIDGTNSGFFRPIDPTDGIRLLSNVGLRAKVNINQGDAIQWEMVSESI